MRQLETPTQVSDAEISRRRELHGLTGERMALLGSHRELVVSEIDGIIEAFYVHQLSIPEVTAVISTEAVRARLRGMLRLYVVQLFEGHCGRTYINNRLIIGRRHEQLGVAPTLFLAAMGKLRELIWAVLERRLVGSPERLEETRQALGCLMDFDTSLVMDTYIGNLVFAIEKAQGELREYAGNLERTVAERTAQLEELTRRDPLTNLYNPRALRELMGREFSHARRSRRPLSLIYFDVDNFKQINDTRGHQVGDAVLECIGRVLKDACRSEDIPCRYGGDEFCVLVVDSGLTEAQALCERVIAALKVECENVSLSMGLAQTGPENYGTADELIAVADRKMYEAKQEAGFQIRL